MAVLRLEAPEDTRFVGKQKGNLAAFEQLSLILARIILGKNGFVVLAHINKEVDGIERSSGTGSNAVRRKHRQQEGCHYFAGIRDNMLMAFWPMQVPNTSLSASVQAARDSPELIKGPLTLIEHIIDGGILVAVLSQNLFVGKTKALICSDGIRHLLGNTA